MISCIIPNCNDDVCLTKCLNSLKASAVLCEEEVEIIVVENTSNIGREISKNVGSVISSGNVLVFLDADNTVSYNFLPEIEVKSKVDKFVGGGVKYPKLSRYSLGILCGLFRYTLILILCRITIGAFWVKKDVFNSIGGFNVTKYDDIDFALKLKKYAKSNKKKFESLKDSYIIWSTRKFDTYGDWHWLKGYQRD